MTVHLQVCLKSCSRLGFSRCHYDYYSKLHCAVFTVNQIEIHPFLAWDELALYCKQEGIPIMAYSPLAKGMRLRNPNLVGIAKK